MEASSINNDCGWNFITNRLPSLNPYQPLKDRVQEIASRSINLTDHEITDLKEALRLSRRPILSSISGIQNDLSKISKKQLAEVLLKLTEEEDVEGFFKAYLALLNESQLMDLLDMENETAVTTAIGTKILVKNEALKSALGKEGWAVFNEIREGVIAFMYRVLEMFIDMTGFNELLEEPQEYERNSYAAKARLDMFMEILASPRVLFEFFSLYVATIPALGLTSTILLSVPAFILYYQKYLKRCPKTCTGLNNLKKAVAAKNEPVYAIPGVLNQMKSAFLSGKGVLLIGDSGCGKTSTVAAFVQHLITGEFHLSKNLEIFGTNAARFTALKNSTSFDRIEATFENHADEVAFFFDEFAAFFNGEGFEGGSSANEIKTFAEQYRYVIGATTTEEYNKFIKDNKTIGGRRFQVIALQDIVGKVLKISLYHYLHEKHPEITLEKGVVGYIAKNAKQFNADTSMIDAAISLLKSAVTKFTELSFDDAELSKLQVDRDSLAKKLLIKKRATAEENTILKTLNDQIKDKTDKKNAKIKRLDNLKKIEATYLRVKRRSHQIASENCDKKEWLKNEALAQMMDCFIQEKRKSLGLFPCLNKDLVDSILNA